MKLAALSVAFGLLAGPVCVFADDLDDAYDALKQAQSSKDTAKIKTLAAAAHAAAKKYDAPAPADTDKEAYEARVKYAKEVDAYSEYALYTGAIQTRSADLINALEQQNPKSQYLDMPEAIVIELDTALSRKQTDRAVTLANRLIAAANKKAPEGVSAADWDKAKDSYLGRGYYVAGVSAAERNKYAEADRNLRSALPLIKGNNAMMGPALFYLGVVNYNLANMTANKAKMQEAAKFSEQAAAIPGPTQDQAYKNSMAMKAAADKMR